LVCIFNLVRASASKYVDGADLIGEQQLYRRPPIDGRLLLRHREVREALAEEAGPAGAMVLD
jgi:hypothetical protein